MFEWILGAPIIKTVDTFHDNRVPTMVYDNASQVMMNPAGVARRAVMAT
jgi:hypothetical protein